MGTVASASGYLGSHTPRMQQKVKRWLCSLGDRSWNTWGPFLVVRGVSILLILRAMELVWFWVWLGNGIATSGVLH